MIGNNPEHVRIDAEMIRTDARSIGSKAKKVGNNIDKKGVEVMAAKVNPEKVKADCETILGVWKGNTDFKMKEVTWKTLNETPSN